MKKLFKFASILAVIGIALFGSFQLYLRHYPQTVEHWFHKKAFQRNGLEVKTIDINGEVVEYAEGGTGETIVFVHGFQGDKLSFINYVKYFFSKGYHVVAIDLPGHGGSAVPKDQKFDIHSLSKNLDRFIKAKGLEKFHLVGNSLGGGVSTVYASFSKDKLLSLSLLNPLGVAFEEKSDFLKQMDEGKNVFFPNTLEDLDELYVFLIGRPVSMPSIMKKSMLGRMIENREFYKKAFSDLVKTTPINDLLPSVETNTLVVVGGRDKILPPSSFEIFDNNLPHSTMCYIPEGTHIFVDDAFTTTIDNMHSFFQENSTVKR